jgi:hypothetical protein
VTKSGQTSKTRSFWAIQVSSEQYATFPVLIASNYGFLKLYVVPTCTFAVYLGPLEFFGVENQNGVLPPPQKDKIRENSCFTELAGCRAELMSKKK